MARGLRPLAASAICRVEAGVISGAGGLIRPQSEAEPRWPPRLRTIERLASGGEWPGAVHVEAVGTYSRSQSDVRMRTLDGTQYHKSVGPCTTRQGSLGSRGICNASESVQGELILIPRPSRAREVVTPRRTNMGAVAHNRTSLKSERTVLVCWGLKWEMKQKRALYRGSQAGESLMTHTHSTRDQNTGRFPKGR